MRHRWYAGGIAALLSGALIFTGVTPALAESVAPPTEPTSEATSTAEPTPPAEETPAEEVPAEEVPAEEIPAEEVPAEETPAEEVPAEETPAEEVPAEGVPTAETPAEEPPAEETTVETTEGEVDETETSSLSLAEAADDAGIGIFALGAGAGAPPAGAPAANEVLINIQKAGDRTGTNTIGSLGGATFAAYQATSVEENLAGDTPTETCTTDSTGRCWMVVPTRASGGYVVVETAAPAGYQIIQRLTTSTNGLSVGDDHRYGFFTGGVGAALSQPARTFTFPSSNHPATSGANLRVTTGSWANPRTNPALPAQCGLNVGLLVDLSASVNQTAGGEAAVRNASVGLVDALTGTPSQVAIHTFGTLSPAPTAANANVGLQSVADATAAAGIRNKANNLETSTTPTQFTNWDAGLWSLNPLADNLDAVVVITDGMPTRYGSEDRATANTRFIEIENAVASANALKAPGQGRSGDGVRIIAVGVGAGVTGDAAFNLAAISGGTAGSDYYQVGWEELAQEIRDLANATCSGTVNVLKQVIPVGGGTPANTSGWTFNASASAPTVRIDEPGQSYATTASGQTGATGVLSFRSDFSAGTTADGRLMTISETPGAQYSIVPWPGGGGANGHTAGDYARCVTTAAPNTPINVDNTGTPTNPGFRVAPIQNSTISCTVRNQAEDLSAQLRVDKVWRIDNDDDGVYEEVTAANVSQSTIPGLGASVSVADNAGLPAGPYSFGQLFTNLQLNSTVAVSETVSGLPPLCTNVATYSPALQGGLTTLSLNSTQGVNVVTITNTVTCESRLTLVKSVADGTALPTEWNLDAIAPAGASEAGPNGVSGTPGATANVSPTVTYALAEAATTPLAQDYVQSWAPTLLSQWEANRDLGATGSWVCVESTGLDENGQPIFLPDQNQYDGRNGGVTVKAGQWAKCTAVNLLKPTLQLVKKTSLNGVTTTVPVGDPRWNLAAAWTALSSAESGGSQDIPLPNPAAQSPNPITGDGGFAATRVTPGHFILTEEGAVPGYANGTTFSCVVNGGAPQVLAAGVGSLLLRAGDAAVCEIVNVRQTGTLTIVKDIVNPEGVVAGTAFSGTYSCDDTNPQSTGTWSVVGEGTATLVATTGGLQIPSGTTCLVGETTPVGGLVDASWEWGPVTITQADAVIAGGTVTATVTNPAERVYGSITITKALAGTPSGFTGTFTGTWSCTYGTDDPIGGTWSVDTTGAATLTGSWNQIPLTSTCSVTENTPSNALFVDPSYTWVSHVVTPESATVSSEQTPAAFTVTNTADRATIQLLKLVPSANGGDPATATQWELVATQGGTELEFTTGDPALPATPGSYVISERSGPEGYLWTDLTCTSNGTPVPGIGVDPGETTTVPVAAGSDVVCTLTNTAQLPELTLIKIVDNQNGIGSATPDQWTLSATAGDGDPVVTGDGTATGVVMPGAEYTLDEAGGPSGYEEGTWSCYVTGSDPQVAFPVAGDIVEPVVGTDVTCEITNTAIPAEWNIAKDVVDGSPVQNDDGTWTILYDVVVTNESDASTLFYDLSDTLQFGGGITPDLAESTWTGPDGVEHPFDTLTEVLATDTALSPAAGTHTYRVAIVASIADGTQDSSTWECTSTTSPNRGFLNSATIEVGEDAETVTDCAQPAFPEVVKTGNPAAQTPDGSWIVSYTLELTNPSAGADAVDIVAELTDTLPTLPSGWTLTGGVWAITSGAGTPAFDGDFAPGAIAAIFPVADEKLPADTTYTYTVSGILVATADADPIGTCNPQVPGTGLVNTATVTSGNVTETDDGCVSIVMPPVEVFKSDGAVTQLDGGLWQIDYEITVNNTSATTYTVFTLEDLPDLGTGFSIVDEQWVSGPTPLVNTPIGLAGTPDGSKLYTYRVIASFTPVAGAELLCVPGQGGAFYNVATVTFPGGPPDSDDGCADPATPTVVKTATTVAQNGTDWDLAYSVTVSNDSDITLWYSLSDTPDALPPGVDSAAWSISGPAALNGGTATAAVPAWDGGLNTQVGTGTLLPGTMHVYTVTATVTLADDVALPDLLCGPDPFTGVWNSTTVTNGVGGNTSEDCNGILLPAVEVEKADATASQGANGVWDLSYAVTVTNQSNSLNASYSLSDTPDFGDNFDVVPGSERWTQADVEGTPSGVLPPSGTATWVFHVQATATTPAEGFDPETALECTPADEGSPGGGGFHNIAIVTFPGGSDTDDGCGVPASPLVEKTAAESVQDPTTGAWTISYEVSVSNVTGMQLWYSVTDTPDPLPTGVTGGGWTASGPVSSGGGTGVIDSDWDGGSDPQFATGVLPDGATHTYTVSRVVTVAASVPETTLDCQFEGGGIWNTVTVSNGIGGNTDEDCAEIERPTATIDKTITDVNQLSDGTWEIVYDIVVSNDSATLAAVYDLDDTLMFGGDIVIDQAETSWSGPAVTDQPFTFPGGTAEMAVNRVLAPDGEETYTVTVYATIDAEAWEGDTLACVGGDVPAAGGFLNTVILTVNGVEIPDEICGEPELPTFQKVGVSAVQDAVDATKWTVTYDLTVTSGGFDTFYSLSDTPAFAPGIDVLGGSAQRTDIPGQPVITPIASGADFVTGVALGAADVGLAAHVYRVSWNVDITDAFTVNNVLCNGAGTAFFNTATLTIGEIPIDAEDCIPVADRVYPTPVKTVTSTVQDPETGEWVVEYEIVVTLPTGAANPENRSAEYDLEDTLDFGGDIDVTSATWDGPGGPGTFDASDFAQLATDRTITPAAPVHTYTITATASVPAADIASGATECVPDSEEPSGFLNTALLTSSGNATEVEACSEPAFPEVVKTAGDYTLNDDGTQTIEYVIEVLYPAAAAALPVIPGVAYDLTDAPVLPEGVTLDGDWTVTAEAGTPTPDNATWNGEGIWTIIEGAQFTPEAVAGGGILHTYTISATVIVSGVPDDPELLPCDEGGQGIPVWNEATIESGEHIDSDDACQSVHYDDVGLVKTAGLDEGETSVEPGDEFNYVLTVTNHGTRTATAVHVTDVDLHERLDIVSLTVAPAELEWNEPGWSENSQTQSNDRVDLTIEQLAPGQVATITFRVEFLPFEQPPVLFDHDGDPATPPIVVDLPPLVGAEAEVPEVPGLVEEFLNTACVETAADPTENVREGEFANCDSAEVPARDVAAVVYTRCVNDAPFLGWVVVKTANLAEFPATVHWEPVNDDVTPETEPPFLDFEEPADNVGPWNEEVAWPGSVFTPSGVSIDYPGWRAIEAGDMVPLALGGGYYLPGTSQIMTPDEQADYVFNGLILDPSELDFAWRGESEITIEVNPTLVFTTSYPPATPACFVARHTELEVEKTASVAQADPGTSFTYDIAVENVSDDSAAEGVVVTDVIPADIKITDVSWPGEGDDTVFPNWDTCAVSGQNSAGFGGTLTCVLFGPLQPANSNNGGATSAPTITLAATVSPSATASVITNIAVVDYHTFGDPSDPGRDSDDAVVALSALPATGGSPLLPLTLLALLTLLGGAAVLIVVRRRRGQAHSTS